MQEEERDISIGRSASIISIATIVSRLTGFIRTWALAFALGNTLLSSAYQVANNLPNMLYEMVMGGILVTAFLPVYMQVKKRLGKEEANTYASNILTITFIFLGIISILATIFAAQMIYTQNFLDSSMSSKTNELATFFFRFFAIQIVLYGASSIVSGILNAERDYLWSSIAPIFNNLVTIITMFVYVALKAISQQLALTALGIGTTLGVFAMLAIQLPALSKNNIRLKFYVNLKDPALKDTLKLGLPALLVMLASSVATSVQNAVSLAIVLSGPSIIYYARLWYTLPYSFLAVPIHTTLFTELSEMYSEGDIVNFKRALIKGTRELFFMLIPFSIFLIVFADPLITLFHIGAFDQKSVHQIALYLQQIAPALSLYAVMMFLNKVFSAMHKMSHFAIINVFATMVQIVFLFVLSFGYFGLPELGMFGTAIARWIFNFVNVVICFYVLRRMLGLLGLKNTLKTIGKALGFGFVGGLAGWLVLQGLYVLVGTLSGSPLQALAYVSVAGSVSVLVSFGGAALLKLEETAVMRKLLKKVVHKFK
ncbi:MAG: murein biosynthesis integral membrane protein MurJ [Coriobacteriia bacterium]|nr:murein biosynthesis integral membrane protein MurJ [Coriobacteriia bacterium]